MIRRCPAIPLPLDGCLHRWRLPCGV